MGIISDRLVRFEQLPDTCLAELLCVICEVEILPANFSELLTLGHELSPAYASLLHKLMMCPS